MIHWQEANIYCSDLRVNVKLPDSQATIEMAVRRLRTTEPQYGCELTPQTLDILHELRAGVQNSAATVERYIFTKPLEPYDDCRPTVR